MPKQARLAKRARFLELRRSGRAMKTPGLVLLALGTPLGHRRLGVTVSKRCCRRAVDRNRVRRWLREIFRHDREQLPPSIDLVIIARDRALEAGFERLRKDFGNAARRLVALGPEALAPEQDPRPSGGPGVPA